MDQASLSLNLPMNMARSSGFSKSPSASSLFAPRVPDLALPVSSLPESQSAMRSHATEERKVDEELVETVDFLMLGSSWLNGSGFLLFWTTNGWPCRGR